MGSGPGSLRIPAFVDDSISAMRQMDMSIEGVFRKNGNIRRLKELTEALDKQTNPPPLEEENPVQLAALLKKWLRELPDPLLTSKLQKLWISSTRNSPLRAAGLTLGLMDPDTRIRVLHLTCCLLPKCNRDCMEVVFEFLFWVATFSHVDEETGSKMDLHNIATVITPNVLYAKGKDGSPVVDDSFAAIDVVKSVIENTQDFCQVPSPLTPVMSRVDRIGAVGFSRYTSRSISLCGLCGIDDKRHHQAMRRSLQKRSTTPTRPPRNSPQSQRPPSRTKDGHPRRYRPRAKGV
jgi:RhoGAP domain